MTKFFKNPNNDMISFNKFQIKIMDLCNLSLYQFYRIN